MILTRLNPQTEICSRVEIATSFTRRLIGLIGARNMTARGLFIPECNWVHTFFMKCAIDVIYIDKKMKIKKIDHHLKPWRFAAPVFSANSVIELEAGTAQRFHLQLGEELYVGD